MLLAEVGAQDVGEQVVVAPPLPAVVERDEEQAGPFELHELRRAAGPAGDGVAQRSAEPVQDRGGEQEVAHVVALARQDLVGEVVDDEPVVAGEPGDDGAGIVAILQRKAGQLQGGRPAFGAVRERCDVGGRQLQAHRSGEVVGGLVAGEAQVGASGPRPARPGRAAGTAAAAGRRG